MGFIITSLCLIKKEKNDRVYFYFPMLNKEREKMIGFIFTYLLFICKEEK